MSTPRSAGLGQEVTYVTTEESKIMEADDYEEQDVPAPNTKRTAGRRNHLESLIMNKKAANRYSSLIAADPASADAEAAELGAEEKEKVSHRLTFVTKKMAKTKYIFPIEVRMKGLSFQALVDTSSQKIQTVYNSSPIYAIGKGFRRMISGEGAPQKINKVILDDINLVLRPGKMYLLLG